MTSMPPPETDMKSTAKEEQQWQAEEDVRTLIRAKEIRADKARYRRAMVHVRKQYKAMHQVMEEGKRK